MYSREGQCSETKRNDSHNNRQNDDATSSDNTTAKIKGRKDHQPSKSPDPTTTTTQHSVEDYDTCAPPIKTNQVGYLPQATPENAPSLAESISDPRLDSPYKSYNVSLHLESSRGDDTESTIVPGQVPTPSEMKRQLLHATTARGGVSKLSTIGRLAFKVIQRKVGWRTQSYSGQQESTQEIAVYPPLVPSIRHHPLTFVYSVLQVLYPSTLYRHFVRLPYNVGNLRYMYAPRAVPGTNPTGSSSCSSGGGEGASREQEQGSQGGGGGGCESGEEGEGESGGGASASGGAGGGSGGSGGGGGGGGGDSADGGYSEEQSEEEDEQRPAESRHEAAGGHQDPEGHNGLGDHEEHKAPGGHEAAVEQGEKHDSGLGSMPSREDLPWDCTPVAVEEKVCAPPPEWVLPHSTPRPIPELQNVTAVTLAEPPSPSSGAGPMPFFQWPPSPSTMHPSLCTQDSPFSTLVAPPSPPPSAGSDSAISADVEFQVMVTGLEVMNFDPRLYVRGEVGPDHAQEDLVPFPAQAGSDDSGASSHDSHGSDDDGPQEPSYPGQ